MSYSKVCSDVDHLEMTFAWWWSTALTVRVIEIRGNHIVQQVTYGTLAVPTEIQLSEDQLHVVTNDIQMVGEPSASIWVLCIDPDKVDEKTRQPANEYYFEQGNKHKEYNATATVRLRLRCCCCRCLVIVFLREDNVIVVVVVLVSFVVVVSSSFWSHSLLLFHSSLLSLHRCYLIRRCCLFAVLVSFVVVVSS